MIEFLKDSIVEQVGLLMSQIKLRIRAELEAQGHVLTGKLRDSIDFEIEQKPNLIRALLYMEDYGESIDQGIPAANIPFSGVGGGGTSQYIQGLFSFWLLKGLSSDEALSAAFATANKQKQEGMPTRDSFFHSSNGRRTGFFSDTLLELEDEIASLGNSMENEGAILVSNLITERFEKLEVVEIAA